MLIQEQERLTDLLKNIAIALDIPDHVYEDATLKYEDIGTWLGMEDSELNRHAPEIYPQGSFRLGTVVRPISENDQYDIDLVCHLQLEKEQIAQKDLKIIVGERLKKRDDLKKNLVPCRRCWRLDYPPEAQMPRFHMDILPAIPNQDRPPTGILLTDTDLRLWQKSNPKLYADWFYERMKVVFQQRRAALAESIKANVEEVPEWQVRTPLQRAVQILKRHRDIYFQNDQDNRPASIIITTLAALTYRNQPDIYEALTGIVRDIEANWGKAGFAENRNGRWWLANPVDPEENFADKWNEYPKRHDAFRRWLKKVYDDFVVTSQKRTLNEAVEFLTPSLGRRTMSKVVGDMGLGNSSAMPVPIPLQIQVPSLGNTHHCQLATWPENRTYNAHITGAVHFKERGRKLWNLTERPVPKYVSLRFSIDTNTPRPYEIRWQVVNTGQEASVAGDLRGDFYSSENNYRDIRWESTKYKGTHWIEAFVLKNGVCVARSGKKIVKVR